MGFRAGSIPFSGDNRKVHRVLSLVLESAVKDGRLVRNVAEGASLPRVVQTERRYLTHPEVQALADECGPYRLVVLFLAYTGVRFGEMAALRVERLDLFAAPSDHLRIGDVGPRRADVGHAERSRAARGADPPLPGRRTGRARRRQGTPSVSWCSPGSRVEPSGRRCSNAPC